MSERKSYITVLSVIACFCVVCMHVNRLEQTSFWDSSWACRVVIDGVCYFAVPVFFMISGANLIDYRQRYGTRTFFRKRINKVLIPFLFWSLLGVLYFYLTGQIDRITPISLILDIFNTSYVNTYWFFLPLFMIYLVMPLFSSVEHKKEVFGLLIVSGILFNVILPQWAWTHGFYLHEQLRNPVTFGYVLYILIGYYIDHYELPVWGRVVIYAGGLIGLYFLTYGTLVSSAHAGMLFTFYKGYLGLPAIFYSSAVFLAAKQGVKRMESSGRLRLFGTMAGASFGVYLIHRGILECVDHLLPLQGGHGEAWILPETLLTFALSIGLVKGMQRLPLLRKLVP